MNFNESLSYLYALGYELSVKKFGLENTVKLLRALENPERNFLKVQVAGTNGKGSTCAFLDAICVGAGIKTGLYTSPHLVSITERIKINGEEISEEDFARHATKIRNISEKLLESGELTALPTFFEQVTAISLSVFEAAKIELAILETGLGGRFDATTSTNAEIVALTPIDFDHQDILGNTLAEIAAEKAAIIRADTTVIVAPQPREAERIILGKCREERVAPIFASTDFIIKKQDSPFGQIFSVTFKTSNDLYPNVPLFMLGRHQITNASLAISAAESLRNLGFDITQNAITNGLQTARHKGRLEFYNGILFDGAHNIAGAKALVNYLDEFIKQPITLVFGAMKDKDLREIADVLFPKAEYMIFTMPEHPRSAATTDLIEFVPKNFSREKVFQTSKVTAAIENAREISGEKYLICVTGSLYLVGEAQKHLAASGKH
ncbi:MAG: bifunctional folylpolyglutamate synthase/dihydrofolate synthase [Acidobacteria bacterium]|nr:bifunctional folylpolyglutamate synthase/dihydrofolate synthase [Acidobacteriota bacterium]MCA1637235.1 bifunctional folylpolyglutamate synthase/dihydrofolate synthase [Acidobacteriota bacterium]